MSPRNKSQIWDQCSEVYNMKGKKIINVMAFDIHLFWSAYHSFLGKDRTIDVI